MAAIDDVVKRMDEAMDSIRQEVQNIRDEARVSGEVAFGERAVNILLKEAVWQISQIAGGHPPRLLLDDLPKWAIERINLWRDTALNRAAKRPRV